MAANIYLYCPESENGPFRPDLEEELEAFFGDDAEDCGGGCGTKGFNLDYELADGEDPYEWGDRLKSFLVTIGVKPGTRFDIFPDGWELGMQWRRVEVFGGDWLRTNSPYSAEPA